MNGKMYGRKGSQLLKEFASGEPGQITAFNVNTLPLSLVSKLVYVMKMLSILKLVSMKDFLFFYYFYEWLISCDELN